VITRAEKPPRKFRDRRVSLEGLVRDVSSFCLLHGQALCNPIQLNTNLFAHSPFQQPTPIAFGRLFISNPDLVERIRTHAPLNSYDRTSFYGGGALVYTDYPVLEAVAQG
jgi:hypothetical protein